MIDAVIDALRKAPDVLSRRHAVLGFDGFIDTLVRVVRTRERDTIETFDGLAEFAGFLSAKAGSSCSLELNRITTKSGGNMPNLAAALAGFGLHVDGIGTLGYPEIDRTFLALSDTCTIHSFANPGSTLGLEFDDGKVMLYTPPAENPTWQLILSRIGTDRLVSLAATADLICALNWAEMPEGSQIWEGFLDLATRQGNGRKRIVLLDFSDCTRRNGEQVRLALEGLLQFSPSFRMVLSMNEGEARFIHSSLFATRQRISLESVGAKVASGLRPFTIVIHSHDSAMAWEGARAWSVKTRTIDKPVISTGGGDTFNAGLSSGLLLGLPLDSCLILGNACASHYVAHGMCPEPKTLAAYLTLHKDQFTRTR